MPKKSKSRPLDTRQFMWKLFGYVRDQMEMQPPFPGAVGVVHLDFYHPGTTSGFRILINTIDGTITEHLLCNT